MNCQSLQSDSLSFVSALDQVFSIFIIGVGPVISRDATISFVSASNQSAIHL
jgi:hypothetical protein